MSALDTHHAEPFADPRKGKTLLQDLRIMFGASPETLLDGEASGLGKRVLEHLDASDGLGFTEPKGEPPKASVAVAKVIAEEKVNLTPEVIEKLLAYAKAKEANLDVRARFAVQTVVSFVVIGFAFALLSRGSLSNETRNAIFSLLGVVIGYWLK